jgi:DNA-binding transcriptional LysR family regulator
MADTLALYRSFVRVVEAGSFTAVADELGSTQPTVSRQIAALEVHLGCVLFQRSTRALTLTDDGRTFYALAQRTLEAAAEAETAVGRRKGRPTGTLRLACPVVFGRLHVVPRLGRFLERYPDVAVDLVMNDGFADLVEDGIDLAIRIGEVSEQDLVVRRIGMTRRVTVASPGYLAARGEPAQPSDLETHDCIVYTRLSTGASWRFDGPDGPISVRVAGRLRVNNSEGVREAALGGTGIAVVPVWHVTQEIDEGRLRVILRDFEPKPLPTQAVYPSRRFLPLKVRAMIDFLAHEFELDPRLSGYGN